MELKERWIRLSDIFPQIYRADPYPFRPNERIGPRKTLVHTFLYIFEGSGTLIIGNTSYPCIRDDLFYIKPGTVHYFQSDAIHPVVHASIYFDWTGEETRTGDMSLFRYGDTGYALSGCSPNFLFIDCPPIPVKTHAPRNSKWMSAYLELIDDMEKTREEAVLLRRSLFEQFFAGMIAYCRKPTAPARDPRIQAIVNEMQSLPKHPVTVEQWASRYGLSTSYFHRLFMEETGMSPNAYGTRCKLRNAKKLLRETNQPISAIYQELGFSSVHYFSRLFSKHFGESPSAYRRKSREGYSDNLNE
ncbi:AraC family transcriptional regulator [Cohnella luojiensis]|uniref:AraC family transcriptional regulator n=1 Tax=Cohnella luojiensis TaxID=652876 RepID=A0A4Y8M7B3_9BACL|nr:AraC family transcriptional regulator [Cohnella luojiensis]TFE30609.1 AraC family transcriptional regulator [Cohnella luojiensis]